ncbi:TetR/AcrR family transcriptional regulator [Nocardioides sp. TRM66260-LWL]|uniref:TetR/AcrR family transcriptional regulator n=1 Tax=Nocardioides sp. TRM66260-LWL TaxID=2874478 RepID=UPI001CC7E792|nr:TetR/AcrR family transcriptional regulator [Nocardioides sp. TRM66260-LWL]MBZ5733464.1 TetR/AcrR family transcriptional regulator [Nocardioides sp. TRM66260-LWL]
MSGPGRPRHSAGAAGAGRAEIVDAAAALFVQQGFAATSTRAIAERVGIRQASLYYHFAGKDDLLDEVLLASVAPSLETARALLAATPDDAGAAAAALAALVRADVRTLLATPHNVGTLYLLPEVQRPRHAVFRAARDELRSAYAELGSRAAGDPDDDARRRRGEILLQLVEVVIWQRRERTVTDADVAAIVEACLAVCGRTARLTGS